MILPGILMAAMMTSGCVTNIRELENPQLGFDLPESDCILIEWQECSAARPCMRGDWNGRDYALGFHESPSVVTGKLGNEPVKLLLDQSSVFAYGNHVIEMTYTDAPKKTVLAVTWNEQDQKLIDAQLVQSDN